MLLLRLLSKTSSQGQRVPNAVIPCSAMSSALGKCFASYVVVWKTLSFCLFVLKGKTFFFSFPTFSAYCKLTIKLRRRQDLAYEGRSSLSFYTTADQLETWWDLQRKSGKSRRNFRFEKTIKKDTKTIESNSSMCKLSIQSSEYTKETSIVLVQMLHKQMFQHFCVTLNCC